MGKTREFTSEKDFIEFDLKHVEKGILYKEMTLDTPFDVSCDDFKKLVWIIISFGNYSDHPIALKFLPLTNEIFIGDINDGGHSPRCRIIKIRRQDIYDSSEKLIRWTKNRSYNLWTK